MKTTIEIIDETIEFYNKNPRSTSSLGCLYYNLKTKTKCAFSRCCTEEGIKVLKLHEFRGLGHFDIESIIKEEYKKHELMFWVNLQKLHDIDKNWNDNELTEEGKIFVEKFKERFK